MLYPTENMEQGRLVGGPSRGTLILQSWVAAKLKKNNNKYIFSRAELSRMMISGKEHGFCAITFQSFQKSKEP